MSVTLTARQLRDALEFVAPDMGYPDYKDQLDTEVTNTYIPAQTGPDGEEIQGGYYCHLTEYPEEGSIRLDADAEDGSSLLGKLIGELVDLRARLADTAPARDPDHQELAGPGADPHLPGEDSED